MCSGIGRLTKDPDRTPWRFAVLSIFSNWMDIVNGIVWGPAIVVLLIGTGLFLTIRLRFLQLRGFRHAIDCISGKYDDPNEQGDISHFQALCAALSATIGTGNIQAIIRQLGYELEKRRKSGDFFEN